MNLITNKSLEANGGLKMQAKCEKFYDRLKASGYKITTQRKVVLNAMLENKDKHLTVEEIYQLVKDQNPDIGLATVYRNIQLLNEMKIVEKLNLDDGFTRYELAKEDEIHRHHHLICETCGKVIEVKEDLMGAIELSFKETYGFVVHDHQAKFFGVCEDCLNSNQNDN